MDYTELSKVNADNNPLLYRDCPVQELAARCSFEEVDLLLWNGELRTRELLAGFTAGADKPCPGSRGQTGY